MTSTASRQDATIVRIDARRRVLARIEEPAAFVVMQRMFSRELERGFRKVIAFCDSREAVETAVRVLRGQPPFGDAVFAHHGSLARATRLATEQRFLDAPVALCVATSTMELGIDIGAVDLVVLLGVPPDVQSLVQRIGRGGRRREGVHVVCVANGRFRASLFRTLLEAQRAGDWHVQGGTFRPSVIVQQAVSILQSRESKTIDAGALLRRLPEDLLPEWNENRIRGILAHMEKKGWLEGARGGAFGFGAKADALWRRARLHANITSAAEIAVTDALTGVVIGSVSVVTESGLGLGGKGRRVLQNQGERIITEASKTAELGAFGGGSMKPTVRALASELLRGADIPFPVQTAVSGHVAYFHALGTAGGNLVGEVLKRAGFEVVRAGRFAVIVTEACDDWPPPTSVERALASKSGAIGRALDLGAWHALLPPNEQHDAVAARCEVDAVRDFFRTPPAVTVATDAELWTEAAWA